MSDVGNIQVLSQTNEAVGEIALSESLFCGPVKPHLLHSAVRMQLANRRAGTHSTKTRGDKRGGGRKPWRQKGTGRARAGSSRSPIWVGGATTFGPQPRDYSYRMPKSARKAALRSALASKFADGQVKVIDALVIDQPKTKVLVELLRGLSVTSALIVTAGVDESLERAARNVHWVRVLRTEGVNVYDILKYESLILTKDAVAALEQRDAQ